jgi:hypothetical protein
MKINTSYFPSVIILLGVFIFISLFFGTGNVIPYSKVSNFTSFEGFEGDSSSSPEMTGDGIVDSVSGAVSSAASAVSTAASNLFGSGSSTASTEAPPAAPAAETAPPAPTTEAFTSFGGSYAAYN